VDTTGWLDGVAIPFSALRFLATEKPGFRMQVRRRIARRSEVDLWVSIPPKCSWRAATFRALRWLLHEVYMKSVFSPVIVRRCDYRPSRM